MRRNAQNEQHTLKKTSAVQIYALKEQVVDLRFLELFAPSSSSSPSVGGGGALF